MTVKQILVFSFIITFFTSTDIHAQTDTEENLVKFVDNSIKLESFVYGVPTRFGLDITKKNNGDQVLSPDEMLYFSYFLKSKSDVIDSVEIVAEYSNDPFLYAFYGEEYLKYRASFNHYFFNNPYPINFLGIPIPANTPDGWILNIPFQFWFNNELVGRDTLNFTICGTDIIPPIPVYTDVYVNNPISHYAPVGEDIQIVAHIVETGDLNWVKAVIKDNKGKIIDELQMEYIDRKQDNNYYYTKYTPDIESEFYVDIYAEDLNGNRGEKIDGNRFTTKPYKKVNGNLLLYYPVLYTIYEERLIRDSTPYMEALDTTNCNYDLWDLWLYGGIVDSTILKQYNTVILPADYISYFFLPHIESYLKNNGNLLITPINSEFSRIMQEINPDFLRDYLCYRYVGSVGYSQVDAQPGNNFSEGMALDLVKSGDYIYSEIQPVSPAHPLLIYNTTTRKNLSKQSLSKINSSKPSNHAAKDTLFFASQEYPAAENYTADLETILHNSQTLSKDVNSKSINPTTPGAAAIMVDSTYKLAFLAFPFEAIKYDDDRAELMDRIMNWFDGEIDFETNNLFQFKLRQNYPNPFNNHTTIQYSLSEDSNVAINIYNLQGQLVETLKRNHQRAGSYAVTWEATGCPSGVYFYQIKAGNYVKTKKCVYVK